jgi:peptidoglycan/xylan/chitin deacetylase (PgdA/CDA1 family)
MRIINFHGIGQPRRDLETGEAPFWVSNDLFRRVLDSIAEHPERQNLSITFDDSNDSDIEIALPELLMRGLTASFFVLTGRLGKRGSLSRSDVAHLQTCGMAIGSHGTDHSDLTALSPQRLADELTQSRSTLEEICGTSLGGFAIPFGRYNRRVLRAVRDAGFAIAFSSDGGIAFEDRFLRPRRSMRSDMQGAEIDAILDGRMPPLRQLRRAVGMGLKQLM